MAGVATTQASNAMVSPSTESGGQKSWEYSVPVNQENNHIPNTKPYDSNDSLGSQTKSSQRHPLAHNTNGISLGRKSSKTAISHQGDTSDIQSGSRTGSVNESGYLIPSRVDALSRKESSISRTGSEPDSLLDLYGQKSASRSEVNSMDYEERKGDNGAHYTEEEDRETAKWIHRDKLAKIEREELQQAGIQLPPIQVRTGSKSSGRRTRSKDRYSNETNGTEQAEPWPSHREEKRQRMAYDVAVEGEEGGDGEPMNWDLRTPEEIAADSYEDAGASRFYKNLSLKKSSSRIPVLTSSPLPIPQEHLERETPLQRKRNASGSGGDEDGIAYTRTRNRSQSGASQVLLDDPEGINGTPTPAGSRPGSKSNAQSSPTKAKAPIKATGARKTSATPGPRKPSAGHKPRTSSGTNNSPGQRPVTKSSDNRPSSAVNRPEGDPPWLATMYKPDPRLPPDQQILPTHAKKLQQEQWEKEGVYPTTYDREFAPLAVHTSDGLKSPSPPTREPEKQGEEWPLKPAPKSPDLTHSARPSTSGTDHAGYSTMPKVQSTPPIGMAPSPKLVQQPMRVQEPPPEEGLKQEKEKGCGCCIVM